MSSRNPTRPRRGKENLRETPSETHTASEPEQPPQKQKNDKRKNAYWDSIYTGSPSNLLGIHNWDFRTNKGPSRLIFEAESLKTYATLKNLSRVSIRGITFQGCDFEGDFRGINITFDKCTFKHCDFGESYWLEAKFSGCTFDSCSLTVTEFESCLFYGCEWNKLTVSGTETKLNNTLVTNPSKFIAAAYTNTDPKVLEPKYKTASYQLMRLETTKVKIARVLHKSAEGHGDEEAYYDSIKTKINQSIKASNTEAIYNFRAKKNRIQNALKFLVGHLEFAILNSSASINAWGRSIVRPTLLGLAIMLLFGACYGSQLGNYYQGLIQGFDITFLVGYTKYANSGISELTQALYALNAFLGLWWYAILVPTLINRLSRVS